MTLPLSGPITFAQINTEIRRSADAFLDINDPVVRNLAGKPTGAISIDDLYGKSYAFIREVTSSRNNLVLSSLFSVEEWIANVPKEVEIASGVTIGSTNPSIAALSVGISMGGSLRLINRGNIDGAGGNNSILTGGTAIQSDVPISVDNYGSIRAGGGAGGVGGQGGAGIYSFTYTEGPIFSGASSGATASYAFMMNNGFGNPVWWAGVQVGSGQSAFSAGGWTYVPGAFQGTNGSNVSMYAISRQQLRSQTSVGGSGGLGGLGRGHGQTNTSGATGGSGTQGSGNGGQGGAGGDWGASGVSGSSGSAGNNGSGSSGSSGGLAGFAITGYNSSLHKNFGTLLGRL